MAKIHAKDRDYTDSLMYTSKQKKLTGDTKKSYTRHDCCKQTVLTHIDLDCITPCAKKRNKQLWVYYKIDITQVLEVYLKIIPYKVLGRQFQSFGPINSKDFVRYQLGEDGCYPIL